jgi:hypothetical protein
VVAIFSPITYDLTLEVNGSGTTNPAAGVHAFTAGTVVTIAATPAGGWEFDGWTGDVASPISLSTTVTMNSSRTVVANFSPTTPLPGITVLTPNGGENWAVGSSQTISWTSNGFTGLINILLSRDGGISWAAIISSTANDGSQTWTVSGPVTTLARIKVRSVSSPGVNDSSNTNFTISEPVIKTVSIPDSDLPPPPVEGMTIHFVPSDQGDPGPGKITATYDIDSFSIWFGVEDHKLWIYNLPKRDEVPGSLLGFYDSLGIDENTVYTEEDGKYWFTGPPPWINIAKYDPDLTSIPILVAAVSYNGWADITYIAGP